MRLDPGKETFKPNQPPMKFSPFFQTKGLKWAVKAVPRLIFPDNVELNHYRGKERTGAFGPEIELNSISITECHSYNHRSSFGKMIGEMFLTVPCLCRKKETTKNPA